MPLQTVGINHKTAPLALREQLVFNPDRLSADLEHLVAQPKVNEAVILSTCNRSEIYCHTNEPLLLPQWLSERHGMALDAIQPFLYTHSNQAAVAHTLRVASGLDSMIIGEPQILGQMKQAFLLSDKLGVVGSGLRRLFDYVFSVTKQVRHQTGIGTSPVSVAYAAVNQAKHIFSDFKKLNILCIGAGETIELSCKYLIELGVENITIANRTEEKANQLAEKCSGAGIANGIKIGAIPDVLSKIDIVFTATASQLPIVGKGLVETALRNRKRRPLLMLDLAVPRDIESQVADLADVYLYTIDDLQDIIQDNLSKRQRAAEQAERIIQIKSENYMQLLQSLGSVDIIKTYREQMDVYKQQELALAKRALENGEAPVDIIEKLAYRLTNKFTHHPSVMMRQASFDGDDDLLNHAEKLLQINSKE